MDGRDFDALLRAFVSQPGSRRRVVAGLLAGLLGGTLAPAGRQAAANTCMPNLGDSCSDQGRHGLQPCCKPLVCIESECAHCLEKGERCHNQDCCRGLECHRRRKKCVPK